MKKLLISLLLISGSIAPAFALDMPKHSKFDARIKYVRYNSADVVQVDTVVGVATHFIFEDGENYVDHVFGDSAAYEVSHVGNHMFIKPKAIGANTNLIVVTDKRSYNFRLSLREVDRAGATYQIAFSYPDTIAKNRREAYQKKALEKGFNQSVKGYNLAYTMSGHTDIAPVNAWDNGLFTYLKFAPNTDLPTVYMVDNDDKETIPVRNTVGTYNNIIKLHNTSRKWILRSGKRVLAVYNSVYNPNAYVPASGTISPTVQRQVSEK